jgi:hypothetical protein
MMSAALVVTGLNAQAPVSPLAEGVKMLNYEKNKSALCFFKARLTAISNHQINKSGCLAGGFNTMGSIFSAKRFGINDTLGEGFDTDNGDPVSQFTFKVDNALQATITNSGMVVNNISLSSNTINTTSSALTLTSNNGIIQVAGYLTLIDQSGDPALLGGATKLYTKSAVGGGDTGIYYVNSRPDTDGSTVVTMTEELVSRKRALLLSFIF